MTIRSYLVGKPLLMDLLNLPDRISAAGRTPLSIDTRVNLLELLSVVLMLLRTVLHLSFSC